MHTTATPISPSEPAPAPDLLDPQQVQAAHRLATGAGFSEVCHELGIGRATLYRWRQDPDFAAYLHQLLRQTADQATCRSTHLLELAHDVLEELLTSPDTPEKLRIQIAFRIASLYSRPSHLKYLQSLPDDPDLIAQQHARDTAVLSGQDSDLGRACRTPPDEPEGPAAASAIVPISLQDYLAQAKALNAGYRAPEGLRRSKMKQNETSGATPKAPAMAPTALRTPPEPLLGGKMRQNETSGAPSPATANAVSAALAGVRHSIAAAVQ